MRTHFEIFFLPQGPHSFPQTFHNIKQEMCNSARHSGNLQTKSICLFDIYVNHVNLVSAIWNNSIRLKEKKQKTNGQVNSPTVPTEWLVMVQFSKRDDGIGSRIRAISGRFTRRDAIYLLQEVRQVVGRAPKNGCWCYSLSNFPICPTVRIDEDEEPCMVGFGRSCRRSPSPPCYW